MLLGNGGPGFLENEKWHRPADSQLTLAGLLAALARGSVTGGIRERKEERVLYRRTLTSISNCVH